MSKTLEQSFSLLDKTIHLRAEISNLLFIQDCFAALHLFIYFINYFFVTSTGPRDKSGKKKAENYKKLQRASFHFNELQRQHGNKVCALSEFPSNNKGKQM